MRRLSLALLLLALPGCAVWRARPVALEAEVVNDGNRVLTLEGQAQLPDRAPLEAVLTETEERVVARGRGTVHHGRWFLTLDVSLAPGNTPMDLAVVFDPVDAPSEVQREVGGEGQRMVGEGVEFDGSHPRLVERLRIVLPMNRRDAGIREVMAGDFEAGIAALEPVLERTPGDVEAGAWLGLALLQRYPAERRPRSRAHQALLAARKAGVGEPARSQVEEWLARLEREASLDDRRRERSHEERAARERQERRKRLVEPGRALGGIDLGAEAGVVFGQYRPAAFPTWGTDPVVVTFPQLPGVEVEFDGGTRLVTRISTSSEGQRLEGGLGVGSPFMAFQERFPGLQARFGPLQAGPDGVRRSRGEVRSAEGLLVVVEREVDDLGLPMDGVVAIGVVPPTRRSAPGERLSNP